MRRGPERLAFVFLLLAAAGTSSNAVANAAFALCLLFTIAWRVAARRAGEPFFAPFRRPSPLNLPLATFVFLSALSCFLSTDPARSIPELKGLLTFALVPLTLALVRDERDGELLLDLWRVVALLMVALGLREYASGSDSVLLRMKGWQSVHMTYAGLLTTFLLALAGRGLSRGRTRASRWMDLGIAGLAAATVALSLTRGALLGIFAGLLALLVVARPKLLPALPVAAVVFYLALPGTVRDRVRSMADVNDDSARDRLARWQAGAQMVKDHPLAGVGPGRVKELYPSYAVPGAIYFDSGHLHNNVVMVAAETGVPSALAYLWLVGAFVWGAVRLARSRSPGSTAARAALAAVAGLFVVGLFDYNFGDVEVLRATLVLMALPFGIREPEEGPAAAPASREAESGARSVS